MDHEIYLCFKSTLEDEAKWTDDDELVEPAGHQHSEFLFAHLPEKIERVKEPWNEEDYAWEFSVRTNGIAVSVLLAPHSDEDGEWLATVIPVALFAFLRRKAIQSAVEIVAASIEELLRSQPRFSGVRRTSPEEVER